ncbi:MAG: hypothetical protein KJ904_09545 [Alphaproteobacteria bacterium]|nr:hypothetical protein [Alphaproteobacteria bacterium]MBU0795774.1 hypothetical protein [Alphaproteobacteria bacterium]MBU0887397.1 hypothetical protein [Alphaproteobacteria bacterium]MBU1811722.1 hypothetical protein [Alphaproteobacteria bacterium]MBU2088995.1 hypothetical protein [Alphaproteobacteria bacterium]
MRKLIFLMVLLLAACASRPPPLTAERLYLAIAPDANGNSAFRLDVILLGDPALAAEILALTPAAWFAQRDQMVALHGASLALVGAELVPGQAYGPVRLKAGFRLTNALIAIGYDGAAAGFVVLGPARNQLLTLSGTGFSLGPATPGTSAL